MRNKIKLLAAALMLAVSMATAAGPVYVSRTGKSYHSTPTCWSLSRSKSVTTITLEEAQKRNLKPCKMCVREGKVAR